mmetsp:Transcript_7022/g.10508  ORF Transcript_7022/g.10508 Transcript_7022/m.10508 type:complete len:81 (+) Transcript_7022:1468-1710(+)
MNVGDTCFPRRYKRMGHIYFPTVHTKIDARSNDDIHLHRAMGIPTLRLIVFMSTDCVHIAVLRRNQKGRLFATDTRNHRS